MAIPTSSSVSTTRIEYDDNLAMWVKCRDVVSGSDVVKSKGITYLPKLAGQDSQQYEDYKNRALFYGAVKRTLRGMAGMVFMKDPSVEGLPESTDYMLSDATMTDKTMAGFAKTIFKEVMAIGRVGIMVDMPRVGSEEQRPYFLSYEAEQIINWRQERIGGRMVTTLVVLAESYEDVDENDPFTVDILQQYKVLSLDRYGPDGQPLARPRYAVRIYREEAADKPGEPATWILYDETFPVRAGVPLDFIPFLIVGPEDITFDVQDSPMADMADVILSHYRTSADLENGRHWCGIPQPYITGFPDSGEWKIGGDAVWQTTEPSAKAEFMEFRGTGLGALEKALEEKEAKLAVLGMRILETQRKSAEQPEALRLRMLGDVSTLQGVVRTVSQALTQVLQWAVAWVGSEDVATGITLTLNTDYNEISLSAQDLLALVQLWQTEGISYKTLYANLQRGELTREGVDDEAEQAAIQVEREQREGLNRVEGEGEGQAGEG